LSRIEDLLPPNDQVKPHGQAARTTTDDQRSHKPSQAETPPLVRVGLNRLFGILFVFMSFDLFSIFNQHWRPKAAASERK